MVTLSLLARQKGIGCLLVCFLVRGQLENEKSRKNFPCDYVLGAMPNVVAYFCYGCLEYRRTDYSGDSQ